MGRSGRGVDTFERWRHLLGVNRNYNIYIIPIYGLKLASPFQGVNAPTVQIFPREGKGRGWKGKGMERGGTVRGSIPSKDEAIC